MKDGEIKAWRLKRASERQKQRKSVKYRQKMKMDVEQERKEAERKFERAVLSFYT